jgi:hypothetical protein
MLGPRLKITCISATLCLEVVSPATWWGRCLGPGRVEVPPVPLTGGNNYLRNCQDEAKRGFDVVSL